MYEGLNITTTINETTCGNVSRWSYYSNCSMVTPGFFVSFNGNYTMSGDKVSLRWCLYDNYGCVGVPVGCYYFKEAGCMSNTRSSSQFVIEMGSMWPPTIPPVTRPPPTPRPPTLPPVAKTTQPGPGTPT